MTKDELVKKIKLDEQIVFTISLKVYPHILREIKTMPHAGECYDKNGKDITKPEYIMYKSYCGDEVAKDWPISREEWFEESGKNYGNWGFVCGKCVLHLVAETITLQ